MKTIGLIGGMSWESTASYYRLINEGVKAALGGLHSAQIVLVSIDFAPLEELQMNGDWDSAAEVLVKAAKQLELAGVDAIMICTNTMHISVPQIEASVSTPILHIADATGELLTAGGQKKIALLGTAFTMEQDFYKGRLTNKFGLEVIVPSKSDRKLVHDIIYHELCLGEVKSSSRDQYLSIIGEMADQGAESVILGCTEIGLLIKQSDTQVQLVDTTVIHAQQAVSFLLS